MVYKLSDIQSVFDLQSECLMCFPAAIWILSFSTLFEIKKSGITLRNTVRSFQTYIKQNTSGMHLIWDT